MTQLWVPSSSPLFLYSPSNLVSETLQGQWVSSLAADQPAGAVNQSLWTATASAAILFPSIYCMSLHPDTKLNDRYKFHTSLQCPVWLDDHTRCQFPNTSILGSGPGLDWRQARSEYFLITIRMYFWRLLSNPHQLWRGYCRYPNDADWVSHTPVVTWFHTDRFRTPHQVELDDSAPGPAYNGTFAEVGTGGGQAPVQVTGEDSGSTLSWTGTAGASVSVTFQGMPSLWCPPP
jgi:hypothetical protein